MHCCLEFTVDVSGFHYGVGHVLYWRCGMLCQCRKINNLDFNTMMHNRNKKQSLKLKSQSIASMNRDEQCDESDVISMKRLMMMFISRSETSLSLIPVQLIMKHQATSMIVEIQFLLCIFKNAKRASHQFYEITRYYDFIKQMSTIVSIAQSKQEQLYYLVQMIVILKLDLVHFYYLIMMKLIWD